MSYEREDAEFEIARDWMSMEGCEPSDLLEGLINCTREARDGYGYAVYGNNIMHDRLLECFREQYHGIRDYALREIAEGDPYERWDSDFVKKIKDKEAQL